MTQDPESLGGQLISGELTQAPMIPRTPRVRGIACPPNPISGPFLPLPVVNFGAALG